MIRKVSTLRTEPALDDRSLVVQRSHLRDFVRRLDSGTDVPVKILILDTLVGPYIRTKYFSYTIILPSNLTNDFGPQTVRGRGSTVDPLVSLITHPSQSLRS